MVAAMSGLFSSLSFEIVIGLLQCLVNSGLLWYSKQCHLYTGKCGTCAKHAFFIYMYIHVYSIIYVNLSFLGLFALNGVEISNDVYAWIIVFVLPINSAINPFLYTLLAIRRQKASSYSSLECAVTLILT